jgi:hypothetical protein
MRDEALLAEAQKTGIEIDPISGEEFFATPAEVVERAKHALEYRAP